MGKKKAIALKGMVIKGLDKGKYVRYSIAIPKRRNEGYPPELDALAGRTVTVIIVVDGE